MNISDTNQFSQNFHQNDRTVSGYLTLVTDDLENPGQGQHFTSAVSLTCIDESLQKHSTIHTIFTKMIVLTGHLPLGKDDVEHLGQGRNLQNGSFFMREYF